MNKHNNSNQYRTNYQKERDFKRWKDEEDTILRAAGLPEEKIAILRVSDHEDMVNSRRRDEYRGDINCDFNFFDSIATYDKPIINDMDDLLNNIDDEVLIYLIRHSDEEFKKALFYMYLGYSAKEAAEKYHQSEGAFKQKLHRFRRNYEDF